MFEKDLKKAYLLDFYGDVLTERKKEVLDMYYNEDLSLAEIAEQIGISRQGVRDLIKKAEEEIFFLEEKLGLAQKMSALRLHSDNMLRIAENEGLSHEIQKEIEEIAKIIK
ncbi:MAG: winged helix-turn-helix transcriptional regulator [Clostridia bacterium]|nr:winged helix-turn-helix transcriptional regulator [Clostridia bacterium]